MSDLAEVGQHSIGEVDTHQQKQGQRKREEPVAVLTARVDNLQREDPIMEWTDRSRLSTQTKLEG